MLLMTEIILAIALSALFIYLKREQAKTFIKKITSYKLFPKIFWGLMLGIGVLLFNWLVDFFDGLKILSKITFLNISIYIRSLNFIGPLFGIFIGITIGGSSRPFSIKKLRYCIYAGLIPCLIYSIYLLFLEKLQHALFTELFLWMILIFVLMPIAIGVADRSLFKAIFGLIGVGIGIFLYLVIWAVMVLGPGMWGAWEGSHSPLSTYIPTLIGGILIVIGIEISEAIKDILKD